ncbi:MAG TPA: twin-arginine translocase TatA/TatE family subunit [Steroidobacteraceae bacterium]|jgi:sec-independent protein translocase protein TatA
MFELLIIIVVLLVVFGAGKVRSAGSDLGAAVKGFRKAMSGPQRPSNPSSPADPAVNPAGTLPDAEFPEVLAARARQSSKPGA